MEVENLTKVSPYEETNTRVVLGPGLEREIRCPEAEDVQKVNIGLSSLRLRKEQSMAVSESFLN